MRMWRAVRTTPAELAFGRPGLSRMPGHRAPAARLGGAHRVGATTGGPRRGAHVVGGHRARRSRVRRRVAADVGEPATPGGEVPGAVDETGRHRGARGP